MNNENNETCTFKEFKKFAKQLGYRITSKTTSFGGFGYGSARFFKVFQNDRRIYPLDSKKREQYVPGRWEQAMEQDPKLQEFLLSHIIVDDDGGKCIPDPCC